jgi:hypothetical protein
MTGHGAPILGSRHTSVHYLSRSTGHLFSEVHSPPRRRVAMTEAPTPKEAHGELEADLEAVDVRDVLVVARVTHELEALNPVTQDVLWNVSHSAWRHTPLPGIGEMAVPLLDVSGGAMLCGFVCGTARQLLQHCQDTLSRHFVKTMLQEPTCCVYYVFCAAPNCAIQWQYLFCTLPLIGPRHTLEIWIVNSRERCLLVAAQNSHA